MWHSFLRPMHAFVQRTFYVRAISMWYPIDFHFEASVQRQLDTFWQQP